jgi:hypothetical protein
MIDCIVHNADILSLKGTSYRLRGHGIESFPRVRTTRETESELTHKNVYISNIQSDQDSNVMDSFPHSPEVRDAQYPVSHWLGPPSPSYGLLAD